MTDTPPPHQHTRCTMLLWLIARNSRSTLLMLIGLSATLAAFWPGLSGGFIFDDYPNILSRDAIHLDQLTWQGLWDAAFAFQHGGLARPLANATFALNHIAGGLNPFGYKLVNLAIHLVNTLLIALLTHYILRIANTKVSTSRLLALGTAFLWALHPLQVSTVLYVVQRMEIMCVTFTLIALIAYLRGRQAQIDGASSTAQFSIAGVATLFALGSKENALLIPVYGLALEIFILRFRARTPLVTRSWRILAAAGTACLLIILIAGNTYLAIEQPNYTLRDFTAPERLLSQLEIVPFYLGLILLPRIDAMQFFYDDVAAPAHFSIASATGVALITALIIAMLWLRDRRPITALGIALFLVSHLLTSSAFSLELVFEHRNYFSLFGATLALLGLLPLHSEHINLRPIAITVIAVMAALTSLTAIRSSYWSSPSQLAAYLADINPRSPRAAMDLGEQYMLAADGDRQSSFYQAAISEYQRAALLPPRSIMGEHGLIMMAARYGHPHDPQWWEDLNRKISTPPVRPQELAALLGMVEHRMKGLPLDDRQLSLATSSVARIQPLAPELLFLFANQALLSNDGGDSARELFARGLIAADDEYAERARAGISSLAGLDFLATVDDEASRLRALEH